MTAACHLQLRGLSADDLCLDPRCGRPAREHRNHFAHVEPEAERTPTVDPRDARIADLEATNLRLSATCDELRAERRPVAEVPESVQRSIDAARDRDGHYASSLEAAVVWLADALATMTADRDRWAERVKVLDGRLDTVRRASVGEVRGG